MTLLHELLRDETGSVVAQHCLTLALGTVGAFALLQDASFYATEAVYLAQWALVKTIDFVESAVETCTRELLRLLRR